MAWSGWRTIKAGTVSSMDTLQSAYCNSWKIRKDWLKISVLPHVLQSICTWAITHVHLYIHMHIYTFTHSVIRVNIFILKLRKDYLDLARILYHLQIATVAFLAIVIIFLVWQKSCSCSYEEMRTWIMNFNLWNVMKLSISRLDW